MRTMRALRISKPTPAAEAVLSDVPVPEFKPGWVLVRVRAFGLNNSERLTRLEEIGHPWIAPEVIPGIECAGEVVQADDLAAGTRVVALMGGMGRNFDGSYAEYTLVPRKQVMVVPEGIDWSWEELGAFGETYFTAWGSLADSLKIEPGDRLLVRGASSALGQAAVQLSSAAGVYTIATARKARHEEALRGLGADAFLLDDGKLRETGVKAGKILDLVGAASFADTMRLAETDGVVCETGILGGVEDIARFDPIKDIPNRVYLTGFFSNYPDQATFDAMFAFMRDNGARPLVGKVFGLEELPEALALQEAGFGRKIVVRA